MLTKAIAPLLIGSVMLFTLGPSKTFAQTPVQPKAAASEHSLIDTRAEPAPDLKAAFSKEMANVKARTLTVADYERIQKQQQAHAAKKEWTRGEKIGLVVIIGVVTAFTIAVLIRGINTTPSCVEDPFATNCT